jgi:hypothetical protein
MQKYPYEIVHSEFEIGNITGESTNRRTGDVTWNSKTIPKGCQIVAPDLIGGKRAAPVIAVL